MGYNFESSGTFSKLYFFLISDKSLLIIFSLLALTDSRYPAFLIFRSTDISWAIEEQGKNREKIRAALHKTPIVNIVFTEGGLIRDVSKN